MGAFVVGWGTLALINAAIACAGRRSPLTYLIASLFGGPIITLVLAGTYEDEARRLRQVNLLTGQPVERKTE